MDNKVKLLVIGLGVVAAISLLIAFQLNLTNNKSRFRIDTAEQKTAELSQKNEKLLQERKAFEIRSSELESTASKLKVRATDLEQELAVLRERLDLTAGERDNLIDKVQMLIDDKQTLSEKLEKERSRRRKGVEKTEKIEITSLGTSAATSAQQSYWADVLRQKADAELELENVKSQLNEISYKANELFKERDALKMDLFALSQEKEDLVRRALYNEKLARALSEDLVREKNDKEAVIAQLYRIREDSRMLRSRVKDLESTKTTLYRKIDSLEQQRSSLKRKLDETETMLTNRIDEVVKIRTDIEKAHSRAILEEGVTSRTVELSPIIVRGDQEGIPRLTGRVVSVNRQNKFVIIDLGQKQGVQPGNTLGVYRDDTYIATIEILQLRKEISAADIREVASGKDIEAGDIVKINN